MKRLALVLWMLCGLGVIAPAAHAQGRPDATMWTLRIARQHTFPLRHVAPNNVSHIAQPVKPQQATAQPTTVPPTPTPTTTPTTVPTPVPVQFSVKARWEKAKQQPKLNGAALKTSKVGKGVQADLYLVVDSAPASAPVSIHVEVRRSGKKLASADDNQNLANSDPTGWYPDPFTYKPKKTGSYTIFTRIGIGGKTLTATSKALKVTK